MEVVADYSKIRRKIPANTKVKKMAAKEELRWRAKMGKLVGPRQREGIKSLQKVLIREVWAENFEFELSLIESILHDYPIGSMDTEFPGEVCDPFPDKPYYKLSPTENYQKLKANVDVLTIIQLGLAFSDRNGNLPNFGTQFGHIWEFNFRNFDVEHHPHDPNAIALLRRQGIDILKTREKGIDSKFFASMILKSGLVVNDSSISWYTFHGAYDFGLMINLLTNKDLPDKLEDFMSLVTCYFGEKVYDLKHMIRFCEGLYGGLDKVASKLEVDRVAGKSHQAGSDSLLTLQTSFKVWHNFATLSHKKAFQHRQRRDIVTYGLEGVLYGLELQIERTSPEMLSVFSWTK